MGSEVKVFRVFGELRKPNLKTPFVKEVRALKEEHAVEQVFCELGSTHKAKRFNIKILKVEEIPPEEARNPVVRKLSGV